MEKSLLDIQQEIRDLDNKIQEISFKISSIYKSVDDFRNKDIIKDGIDYEMIHLKSTYFKFGKHPLRKLKNLYACQMYIKILLSLIQLNRGSKITINRLIFIQWLINESGLKIKLKDFFGESLKISYETFDKLINILPKQYKDYLIVDALIIANICGQANEEIFRYIIDLCLILEYSKEEIRIFSIIAKNTLKQNIGKIREENLQVILDYLEKFRHYINRDMHNNLMEFLFLNEKNIVEAFDFKRIKVNLRVVAVRISNLKNTNFKWEVEQKTKVKKDDLIATYKRKFVYGEKVIKIIAPCSGIIFQFENNNINYGVIAFNTDNKDSIKTWALQEKNNIF